MSSKVEAAQHSYNAAKYLVVLAGLALGMYPAVNAGKWSWFHWHPLMMALGSVLALNASLVKKIGGYLNTKYHGNIMLMSTALMGVGFYVIYSNKEMFGKPHNTTTHSWIGLLALLSFVGSCAAGLLGLHPDFGFLKTNQFVRAIHKWSGRFDVLAAWAACATGFATIEPDPFVQLCVVPAVAVGVYLLLN